MTSLYCSRSHENPGNCRFCQRCGEQLPAVATPSSQSGMVGQLLDLRYQIVRELGHGGFGRTYLAEDTHRFKELCVLKEFAPQVEGSQALQKAEELFQREAGVLHKLQHPQIPRFRELFRTQWQGRVRLFLVQDYVDGQTYHSLLQTRRSQGQKFSDSEVTQLLVQVLPILDYIHSCGVIHRDISPDNLIARSRDGLPVLIDFGGVKQIAIAVASQRQPAIASPSTTVTRLGKIGYAPAEQMEQGVVSPHSDLYALAVTALVLLTGKEPAEVFGSDGRQWQRDVNLNPTIMAALDRMVSPVPAKRFQSAQEVLQALSRGLVVPRSSALPHLSKQIAAPPLTAATLAIAPQHPARLSPAMSAPSPLQRRSAGLETGLLLLAVIGVATGGWYAGSHWLTPFLPDPGAEPRHPAQTTTKHDTTPAELPNLERQRKHRLTQRRQALGIDNSVLVKLVDAAFYAKYPELGGRQLSTAPTDAALRLAWDEIASRYLDRLESLSPEARSRLERHIKENNAVPPPSFQ